MPAFGRFLEFSVPAGDVQASLAFYNKLGFTELETGDIRAHHYAVVTDGRIALGLHAGGLTEAALSFVRPGLADYARVMEAVHEELVFKRLGVEAFHELGIRAPDGQLLVLMEARTFSRIVLDDVPPPVLGHSIEISLPCPNPQESAQFWLEAGFIADERRADAITLLAPGVRLGLRASLAGNQPALRFGAANLDELLAFLEKEGINATRKGSGLRLNAPEGTRLLVGE